MIAWTGFIAVLEMTRFEDFVLLFQASLNIIMKVLHAI